MAAPNPNFSTVPILDYSAALDPTRRPAFLLQLRNALINVGFLYLAHAPVDTAPLLSYIPRFFALPPEAKQAIAMTNSRLLPELAELTLCARVRKNIRSGRRATSDTDNAGLRGGSPVPFDFAVLQPSVTSW